jgi:hypothetical protein
MDTDGVRNRLLEFKNNDLFSKWMYSLNESHESKCYQTKELIRYNSAKFAFNKLISLLVLDDSLSGELLYEMNYELYQLKCALSKGRDEECAKKVYSFYNKYWTYGNINEYFAVNHILLIADCIMTE